MLTDIFEMPHLKYTLDKSTITSTITPALQYDERFHERDMVRPAKTRFATAFITLNFFRNHKKILKKIASKAWKKSKFSGEAGGGGSQTANTIFSPHFWINTNIVVKVGEPLLTVDSEKKPLIGYIYEAMDRAMERIASSFNYKKDKYKQNFEMIDKRWNCLLHQDLHVVGQYLNPRVYYNIPSMEDDSDVIKGLMACIHKLSLSKEKLKIHTELPIYRGIQGIFGVPMAKRIKSMLSPMEWWKEYGLWTPTLKKFVVKVLSLTCCSSGCERNWSVFEKLHCKKRNRLEWPKINDLVYIKYNQALRRRYHMHD
uniref:HAT C-terminal dimerisation domain-containing protein n=1 Tax=Lactuca sativa TaxID=4236 RepID=A0A9R1XNH9_LACSA|nr:hypothetical protein LSAT_V11C200088400 [Lactuca sativa]